MWRSFLASVRLAFLFNQARKLVEQLLVPPTDFLDKKRQHRPDGVFLEQRRERAGRDTRCQLLAFVARSVGERSSNLDAIDEALAIETIERGHQRRIRRRREMGTHVTHGDAALLSPQSLEDTEFR